MGHGRSGAGLEASASCLASAVSASLGVCAWRYAGDVLRSRRGTALSQEDGGAWL